MAALAVLLTSGLAYFSLSGGSGYVVQPGDTLWAISRAHGVTVAQLASANRLDPAAILPIGLRLSIPGTAYEVTSVAVSTRSLGSWSFCSQFSPSPGPYGVLPSGLAGTSTYWRLRPLFQHWAAHYGVPASLLEAVAWQESGWNQAARSYTGAIGIGQIEPGTAQFVSDYLVGLPLNVRSSESDNIRASAAFLHYLSVVEGGNTCNTVAAYYEGPLNLQRRGVLPDARQYVADVEALLPRFE